VLSEEDFRRANVEASRTVEIVAFVERDAVPPKFFQTPYYLAPGKRGEKAYALLRETLHKAGKIGIATVVIRTRQYLAAVYPENEVLMMDTLRYSDELRDVEELGIPAASLKGPKVTAKEIDLALRLVEDMAEKWQPEKYKDTYREDLLKRIEQKVKAGQTKEITQPGKEERAAGGAEVIDLMALLKKSVESKGKAAASADRQHAKRNSRKRRAA
jgi:DNA end-binding protein Ku